MFLSYRIIPCEWRALKGPAKEVFSPQQRSPGEQGQSHFTDMRTLGIRGGGLAGRMSEVVGGKRTFWRFHAWGRAEDSYQCRVLHLAANGQLQKVSGIEGGLPTRYGTAV